MSTTALLSFGLILLRRLFTVAVLCLAVASLVLGGGHFAWRFFEGSLSVGVILVGVSAFRFRGATKPGSASWRCLELVAFNLALFLAIGELGLRFAGSTGRISLLLPRSLDTFRLEPGRDYGEGLKGNRLGFPGPDRTLEKPSGTFRVAALGDSFAVGPAVPYRDNYLVCLESMLACAELLNFGVSGAGPREYFEILETHALAFDPDLVLVSFFVGNDITETLATPRNLDPRSFLLYQATSRAIGLMKRPARDAQSRSPSVRQLVAPFSESDFLDIEARRLEVCRTPVPATVEKKWRQCEYYLEQMASTCSRRRIPLVIVLIPDEFQVNLSLQMLATKRAGIDPLDLDMELPQNRVKNILARVGVPCLDLLPTYRAQTETYAVRDTHWNQKGNHLAADVIAAWLAREGLAAVKHPASGPPRSVP